MAHYERSMNYLGELGDDKSTFLLHGVDLAGADKQDVTSGQIRYLVRYLVAMGAKIDYEKESMYEHLQWCTYCRNMLSQPVTQRTYKLIRLAISSFVRRGVDKYLSENYQLQFSGKWADPLAGQDDKRKTRLVHGSWS